MEWLIQQSEDGRDATRTALKTLEEHGYLLRKPRQEEGSGKLIGWDWHVTDDPSDLEVETPLDTPSDGKPVGRQNRQTEVAYDNNIKESSLDKRIKEVISERGGVGEKTKTPNNDPEAKPKTAETLSWLHTISPLTKGRLTDLRQKLNRTNDVLDGSKASSQIWRQLIAGLEDIAKADRETFDAKLQNALDKALDPTKIIPGDPKKPHGAVSYFLKMVASALPEATVNRAVPLAPSQTLEVATPTPSFGPGDVVERYPVETDSASYIAEVYLDNFGERQMRRVNLTIKP